MQSRYPYSLILDILIKDQQQFLNSFNNRKRIYQKNLVKNLGRLDILKKSIV